MVERGHPEDMDMSDEEAAVVAVSQTPQLPPPSTPQSSELVVPPPNVLTTQHPPFHQLAPLGEAPILDFSSILAKLPQNPITAESLAVNFV